MKQIYLLEVVESGSPKMIRGAFLTKEDAERALKNDMQMKFNTLSKADKVYRDVRFEGKKNVIWFDKMYSRSTTYGDSHSFIVWDIEPVALFENSNFPIYN